MYIDYTIAGIGLSLMEHLLNGFPLQMLCVHLNPELSELDKGLLPLSAFQEPVIELA